MNKEQFIKLMTVIKERYYSLESIYDKFNDLFEMLVINLLATHHCFPL